MEYQKNGPPHPRGYPLGWGSKRKLQANFQTSGYTSRRFMGIDLGREPAPDETTVCTFRHLLEAPNLGDRLFVLINEHLGENGLKVSTGTIVDATHHRCARLDQEQG